MHSVHQVLAVTTWQFHIKETSTFSLCRYKLNDLSCFIRHILSVIASPFFIPPYLVLFSSLLSPFPSPLFFTANFVPRPLYRADVSLRWIRAHDWSGRKLAQKAQGWNKFSCGKVELLDRVRLSVQVQTEEAGLTRQGWTVPCMI